jgi:glycosyltransferase involved in cell wall biosynthesis
LERNRKIVFIPPVIWNYYPYRDQELPAILVGKGFEGIYLNPLRYKGCEKTSRFSEVNFKKVPEGLLIIERATRLRKSFLLFLYENYLNLKAVKEYKPATVISTSHLMGVFTCIYCHFRGIKFIFDVTDDWEKVDKSLAGKLYKYVLKPILLRFSFAVTSTSHDQFKYFYSRRKSNTFLISNGISPELFTTLKPIVKSSVKSKEVNFIGSLRDWYDYDLLFQVFSSLPEITLNIYGQGPLLNKLRIMSANIPNIKMHGSIDHRLTSGLLKKSLFGVLPLRQNKLNQSTCPIKLFEFWGASKAVIASPVNEVIKVGGNTLLYASNPEEFLKNARLLLSDPDLANKLGKEGYKKILKIHNYDVIAQEFIHILNL